MTAYTSKKNEALTNEAKTELNARKRASKKKMFYVNALTKFVKDMRKSFGRETLPSESLTVRNIFREWSVENLEEHYMNACETSCFLSLWADLELPPYYPNTENVKTK